MLMLPAVYTLPRNDKDLLYVIDIKKYDILGHHLTGWGEGLHLSNTDLIRKALRIIYLNITHFFYIEASDCNYNILANAYGTLQSH